MVVFVGDLDGDSDADWVTADFDGGTLTAGLNRRIAGTVDLAGPRVTEVSVPDNGIVIDSAIVELVIGFNEPLDPTSADSASNFQLLDAGPDRQLDTPDDVLITVTPTYDAVGSAVRVAPATESAPLPTGLFRLHLTGTGGVRDPAGNFLNDGVDQTFVFGVGHPESPEDNTLNAATSTGLAGEPGSFETSALLGDATSGPTPRTTDVDLYSVAGLAGQVLNASALSGFGQPDLRLRLFQNDGNPDLAIVNKLGRSLSI